MAGPRVMTQDTLGLHGDLRPLVVVPSHLDAKLIQPGECLLGEPLRRSLKLEDGMMWPLIRGHNSVCCTSER